MDLKTHPLLISAACDQFNTRLISWIYELPTSGKENRLSRMNIPELK